MTPDPEELHFHDVEPQGWDPVEEQRLHEAFWEPLEKQVLQPLRETDVKPADVLAAYLTAQRMLPDKDTFEQELLSQLQRALASESVPVVEVKSASVPVVADPQATGRYAITERWIPLSLIAGFTGRVAVLGGPSAAAIDDATRTLEVTPILRAVVPWLESLVVTRLQAGARDGCASYRVRAIPQTGRTFESALELAIIGPVNRQERRIVARTPYAQFDNLPDRWELLRFELQLPPEVS